MPLTPQPTYSDYADQVHAAAIGLADALVRAVAEEWASPTEQYARARQERQAKDRRVRDARTSLIEALQLRQITAGRLDDGARSDGSVLTEEWIDQADTLALTARTSRIPIFETRRLQDRKWFVEKAAALLDSGRSLEGVHRSEESAAADSAFNWAYDLWKSRIVPACNRTETAALSGIAVLQEQMPRTFATSWRRPRAINRTAVARPIIELGRVRLRCVLMEAFGSAQGGSTSRSDRYSISTEELGLEFPVAFDLDAGGGFFSEDVGLIESAVLQLLDTVPPGMLKIHAVDPLQLGSSLNFLYGLNEAGNRVFDDAVWTSVEQTAKLLNDLERQVTFVTQKYLQGRHQTLTAFNIDAEEIAEPYHLVLLYDFPRMFTRDGRYFDEESLSRLTRLLGAARRAGVYFVVATSSPTDALAPLIRVSPAATFGAPASALGNAQVRDVRLEWHFVPERRPEPYEGQVVLDRVISGLTNQPLVRVDPVKVASLAEAAEQRAARRTSTAPATVSRPDRLDTWWQDSSSEAIVARFGRVGSSDVARLGFNSRLESSALVGGRPGSGKSMLLHAIVLDLVTRYGPDELELFLVDLKEGVEFKEYADSGLPHARAIAVESNREFAVSVLRAVDAEITRRGTLFKSAGSSVVDLPDYRRLSGKPLPRVLLVIDEFHKLFQEDDALKSAAGALLERVVKEGRAFGVHAILGSQTIALTGALVRSLADQISCRLVLATSADDSRVMLGEGNPDAQLLTKSGEGILNAQAGRREANERFQGTFWDPQQRRDVLSALRRRADRTGWKRRPVVFEGSAPFSAEQLDVTDLRRSDLTGSLDVVVGAPMSLDPVVSARLDRAPGSNLLVVDPAGAETTALLAGQVLLAGAAITIVDFNGFEPHEEPLRTALEQAGANVRTHRSLDAVLDAALEEVRARVEQQAQREPARVLLLMGLQRARGLSSDAYDEMTGTTSAKLERLLVDGPEHGWFTIAWVDRAASAYRRLTPTAMREFGVKVLGRMGEDDSRRLADSSDAARLREGEVLLDHEDRAVSRVVRRVRMPDPGWLGRVLDAGRG